MKKIIFVICCFLIIVALSVLQFIAIDSYIDEKLEHNSITIEKEEDKIWIIKTV